MEYMALAELVKFGTPTLLFALCILQAVEIVILKNIVDVLKATVPIRECNLRHEALNERIKKLEDK